MFRKIVIFITVFCVVFSCFTLISFADENSFEKAVTLTYSPAMLNPDYSNTWQSYHDFYLFPKLDGQLFFTSDALRFNYSGSNKLEYRYTLGSSGSFWREFDPSTHVLVVPSAILGNGLIEDLDGRSYLMSYYPLSINSSKFYSLRLPFDGKIHDVSISGDAWVRDFNSSNEVWNKMSSFDSLSASSSSVTLFGSSANNIHLDSNSLQYTQFSFSKLFSLTKDYCEFYYLFSDVTNQPLPPPVVPDPPDPDAPDLSDFIYVVDFIVNIFNALDGLVILPGLSILDLVYAYFTIFVVRFFLKLVAGG